MADGNFDPDVLLTEAAPSSATMTIKPAISPAMRGVLDRIIAPGESSGKYDVIYGGREVSDLSKHPDIPVPITSGPNAGLYSTAAGKYQFIKSTYDQAAAATGRHDFSPESQDINAAWLAAKTYKDATGRDIEADYASGDPKLREGIKRALASQWESLGKPGPRMDKLWTLGNDRFQFSDDALSAYDGQDDAQTVYMHPDHYLALSPSLDEDQAFSSAGAHSLRSSLAKGEPINNIPHLTLDENGKVINQDGRSRAIMAKTAGVDMIPVAIKNITDLPNKLTGASGNEVQTAGMVPKAQIQSEKSGGSIVGQLLGITPAHAEETGGTDIFAHLDEKPASADPSADPFAYLDKGGTVAPAGESPAPPSTTVGGMAGAVTRGLAPYAAGAGIGAAAGAPFGGVGAVPGAIAGAGAVGLTDLTSAIYNPLAQRFGWPKMATPKEMTDRIMDVIGVKKPETAIERGVEATAGGAAGGLTGAGAAREASGALTGTARRVAETLAAEPGLQALSGASSGAVGQTAAEMGAGPVGQFAASEIGAMIPGHVIPGAITPSHITPKAGAKAAIEAGYVIPPVEAAEGGVKPYSVASLASGESGKIKTAQAASEKNQPVTNRLAATELGVSGDVALTPRVFDKIRAETGKTYDEVAEAIPEIDLSRNNAFVEAVGKIGKRSLETEKQFPSTTEPPSITALRNELLANSRGTTPAVMNYIADLRFKATQNMKALGDAMAHRMGYAQREAANALEDAMENAVQNAPAYFRDKVTEARGYLDKVIWERTAQGLPLTGYVVDQAKDNLNTWADRLANANAKNQDNQTLIDRYREARKRFAQSYDVEAVTNVTTGDVSARGLGTLLDKGKPLTGNLKLIADSANEFPRAFQNPAAFGGVEPLSVFDLTAAGAAVASGHPLAAVGPVSRPLLRSTILSRPFQRSMIGTAPAISPLPMILNPGVSSVSNPSQGATNGMQTP